ncbi:MULTISPECIES: MFS transporter [Sphingomonadales]|uniref:Major facilitator superfamily MFS_1 n=1 Tax=Rhizorhabdus wittichii (strain DSM 6014 / CCUG 31198 / JCM 15750 / NBRC 105917 / EY 4224 / RW1) TaxID=392499 RepID=A0A9J9H8W5_RHIWR|nr:major facilitator superfamily MFS_1 [Rhizorhabdus wittichii RW1]
MDRPVELPAMAMALPAQPGPASAPGKAARYGWYVVGVLVLAYIAAFLDRQILSLLVGPIKRDIGISDVQIGLLQGLAFAIFYSTCILPAGWLVDRFNRRNILAMALAIWCLMTIACGLSRSFPELFMARMGVGIGEAVLGPAAFSLISNYFAKDRLPLAISVYSIGGSLGAGLAYIFGAFAERMAAPATAALPFLQGFAPWQAAFFIVAAPGFAISLLILTIREPARARVAGAQGGPSLRAFLSPRSRFLAHYCLGIGLLTSVSYANMAWIPAMFERTYGWATADTARWLGLMMLVFGTAGILAGGMGAIRLSRRHADATLRLAAIIALVLAPICLVAAIAGNPYLSLALYVPFTFLSTSFVSLGPTAIQLITPDALRGRVNGIALMLVNIIGISVGPLVVALLTDHLFGREAMLRWGLGIGSGLLSLTAGLCLLTGLSAYRRVLRDASDIEEA